MSSDRSIAAGLFKARCLALLDEVAESGLPLTVTKRGRPVARLVPLEDRDPPSLLGSVRYKREKDLLDPVPETWEAEWDEEQVDPGLILLDTHAWIWWVSEPAKLSRRAADAIDYAAEVGVCPISCWELSIKARLGKLQLDRDPGVWVKQALDRPRSTFVGLTPEIAVRAGLLEREEFHGDPADRLIVAAAIELGCELVSKDRRIRDYRPVRTVW